MHAERRLIILVVVELRRLDHARVFHTFAHLQKKIAHQHSSFATGLELPARLEQHALLVLLPASNAHRLAIRDE